MKFSVCIDALFGGLPLLEGMERAAACGYDAFEFWDWDDKDLIAIREKADELKLTPIGFICSNGILVDAEKRTYFFDGLSRSISAAKEIGAESLLLQTGNALIGVSREKQHLAIVETLRKAAPIVEAEGITLLLEPLNTLVDHAGYYLTSSAEGFQIIEEVNSPNIRLLFDIYHQQITEGNVIRSMTEHMDLIGHIHAAGNPGRNEPTIGELCYENIFAAIEAAGYQGHIGLEYFPVEDAEEGLKHILTM